MWGPTGGETLHAESLAVAGGKLPRPGDVTDARAKLEARVEALRGLTETLDGLFALFLAERLTPKWAEALAGMQRWLERARRAA